MMTMGATAGVVSPMDTSGGGGGSGTTAGAAGGDAGGLQVTKKKKKKKRRRARGCKSGAQKDYLQKVGGSGK